MKKETEDESRNGKISHSVGLEELILLKWPYYPKQSTDLMWPLSNYHDIFPKTRTSNHNSYMEPQRTQNCQSNPEEKNKPGGIIFPDFRQYYKPQ